MVYPAAEAVDEELTPAEVWLDEPASEHRWPLVTRPRGRRAG